ncbi:hypothetical protein BD410DRAFT_340677 [Rickenella mellea]|uniref:Deoxycytidylate deaminase n=1 Tax=Rickenella mellea TaxID=50990 RepID=A0A4Y7QKZ8_9AGAM|nr:hypothetical protein BD410DRAFT_340677 [Rickenella mellea]
MFIIITGPPSSGKSTLESYLVEKHGFKSLRLTPPSPSTVDDISGMLGEVILDVITEKPFPPGKSSERLNGVVSKSPRSSAPASEAVSTTFAFPSPAAMLQHVTHNWRTNLVTRDIEDNKSLKPFLIRPFVLLVTLDARILLRFRRAQRTPSLTLENFVEQHDRYVHDQETTLLRIPNGPVAFAHLHIMNNFYAIADFHSHLEALDLTNPSRLRPDWDSYFMTLASLASHRSNCMKRRVGAILVRDHRIVATGYNGTPRGILNCNDGGCPQCNTGFSKDFPECLCLHAEENALLEAGRERVGQGAVLYCNTCPCLKCTIKIVQTGVKEVVYSLNYKMDKESAHVFHDAGIKLRQYSSPN